MLTLMKTDVAGELEAMEAPAVRDRLQLARLLTSQAKQNGKGETVGPLPTGHHRP